MDDPPLFSGNWKPRGALGIQEHFVEIGGVVVVVCG
jgi:hypothetical protein